MTLDCSGQASFLANQKVTGPKYLGAYDKQIAVFSQVANYQRDDDSSREHSSGNTHIFYKKKYHWAWAIPIDDDITSVGVVIPAKYVRDTGESKPDFLAREFEELNAGLAERIPSPDLVEEPHVIPNYSFQVRDFAGPGYICVGDAHRFVDPIFSFGLYIAIKEGVLADDISTLAWDRPTVQVVGAEVSRADSVTRAAPRSCSVWRRRAAQRRLAGSLAARTATTTAPPQTTSSARTSPAR